jgi:hypothetical protein
MLYTRGQGNKVLYLNVYLTSRTKLAIPYPLIKGIMVGWGHKHCIIILNVMTRLEPPLSNKCSILGPLPRSLSFTVTLSVHPPGSGIHQATNWHFFLLFATTYLRNNLIAATRLTVNCDSLQTYLSSVKSKVTWKLNHHTFADTFLSSPPGYVSRAALYKILWTTAP